ncbi:hypothetical protein ACPV36_04660 [Photobacterium damselae]|uniref:hypothetical protein n=1 Tax=Photobacterium damselae TaxID=38293 RepID=UPI0040696110
MFANEFDCFCINYDSYLDSISGYVGVSEFNSKYDESFLISLNSIELSNNMHSSVVLGTVDSQSFLSADIYYSYKLNEVYSLFVGGAVYHHNENLNIGYIYGFDFNYNERYSFKMMNRSFGAFFSSHDYGMMLGIEYRI